MIDIYHKYFFVRHLVDILDEFVLAMMTLLCLLSFTGITSPF